MSDVQQHMQRFVELYNEPGSPIYELYADEVDWRAHTSMDPGPEGSVGGRAELFAAFDASRGISRQEAEAGRFVSGRPGSLKDMRLSSVHCMLAAEDLGILEAAWVGTLVGPDGEETPMRANIVFVHRFDDDGRITMDHHYWVAA